MPVLFPIVAYLAGSAESRPGLVSFYASHRTSGTGCSCWPHLWGEETQPVSTTQQSTATDFTHLGATTAIAVSYLRVSTKEQAERGGRDEGFSIPAQREANLRKARDLGAIVVEEFVDAGESAQADRLNSCA